MRCAALGDRFCRLGIWLLHLCHHGSGPGFRLRNRRSLRAAIMGIRVHALVGWAIISTVLVEAVTAYLRFRGGIMATEFNKTAPLLLQIHPMFWSLPLLVIVPLVWRKP